MLVVGLTGGIGSGKSTVAAEFAKLMVPIIDADSIARELVSPHSSTTTKIAQHFGPHILHTDGNLNRKKLRKIIFEQPNERLWLEKILHPLIRKQASTTIKKLYAPYCIYMLPLLVETMPHPEIDRILVIDIPEHLQISRILSRDKIDKNQAQAMINSQAKRQDRLALADDVIDNTHAINALLQQVRNLHHHYLQMSKK